MKLMIKTLAVVVAAFIAAPSISIAQDYPELRLKYGSVLPQGNAISDVDEHFAKLITEKSGGQIKVDIYWTRALGKQDEMLPLIAAGAIDLAMLETGQYSETPFLGFMNALPMIHFNSEEVVSTAKTLYEESEPVAKELEAIDARIALVRQSPDYYLMCKSPIKTMADFRGKKLRAYGPYVPLMWEAVGAVPVNVASNELYEALDKGVIDCAYLPPSFLYAFKLHEVAKHLLDYSFGMIELAPIVIPNSTWSNWSPEVQGLVNEAAAEAEKWGIEHIEKNAAESIQKMVEAGVALVKFEEPDALKAAIPDMLDVWREKQEAEGRGEQAKQIVELTRDAISN